jgi:hypothetical protein
MADNRQLKVISFLFFFLIMIASKLDKLAFSHSAENERLARLNFVISYPLNETLHRGIHYHFWNTQNKLFIALVNSMCLHNLKI